MVDKEGLGPGNVILLLYSQYFLLPFVADILFPGRNPDQKATGALTYLWWAKLSRQPSMKRIRICLSVNQQTSEHSSFSASLIRPSDRWIWNAQVNYHGLDLTWLTTEADGNHLTQAHFFLNIKNIELRTASSSCTRSHSRVLPFLQTLSRLMSVTAWLLEYWCLWTAGPAEIRQQLHLFSGWIIFIYCFRNLPQKLMKTTYCIGEKSPWLWLTLHQVLMVDGGQVGEVLLEVGAEFGVWIDLDQLLLAARLLPVKVGHVLLGLGADLGAAAANVVSTQHVLHHGADEPRRVL